MTAKMTAKNIIALLAPLFLYLPGPAMSAGVTPGEATGEIEGTIPTLQQVTVVGQAEDPLTVQNSLDRSQLDFLPYRNGSINENLDLLPGVQVGEGVRTSDNAGEILPPNLSISGGRFYDNNFTIDGISNNSLLDPSGSDIDNTSDTPGHPQENFLHPSLVDNVTVYRSNIPARYGQFTGGVVEIETRDPADTFGGKATIRHTRSEWTSIHRDSERKAEYQNPYDGSVQPKFRKYDGSFSLDLPISEDTGVLASYSRIYSKIPLLLIDETENQYRTSDNYFLKYVANISAATKWSVSATYSPYDAEYYRDEVANSRYTLDNNALGLTSNLRQRFDNIDMDLDLGYRKSTNSREAPDNAFNWQVTPSKPWGAITDAGKKFQYSKEGGFGDLEKEQESYNINAHFTLDPIRSGTLWHNLNYGFSYEDVQGRFERDRQSTNYILARANSSVVCEEGSFDCISGEQFMTNKLVYRAEETSARIRFYDAYLEDQISIGRLTVRPGVRLSYDDLQENTNWAHRLSAGFDLFGDGATQIFAGLNRYYGKTLLTNALRDRRLPAEVWRRSTKLNADGTPKDWEQREPSSISTTRLSDLETPYTDEITVGFDQQVLGGVLNLTYINRDSEEEISSTVVEEIPIGDGLTYKYTEWTNEGSSEHEEVSLSWERQWRDHYLMLSATWQETETSNSDYDQRADLPDDNDDGTADPVWYHGRVRERDTLPRPDYNREYTASLTYIGRLPHGFTFTNITRYRSGYYILVDTREDYILPSGQVLPIYDEEKQPESWIFDWRLEWETALFTDQAFIASVEVNNVFNQKVLAGANEDVYELGRQFWLGMTYKF